MPGIGSSRTWSQTSGKSSTSDAWRANDASLRRRLAGLVRLIHPFPSLLDGVATVAIALVAGGDPATAVRLGGSMLALQASIGALNDIVDATADAGRKPGKPIPSGVVSPALARGVVVLGAATGLALVAASAPWLLMIAVLILAVGYGYDLRAKGTRWSWLPFAIGIPLLPVFAWFGVAGRLPGSFAILVPAAMLAGSRPRDRQHPSRPRARHGCRSGVGGHVAWRRACMGRVGSLARRGACPGPRIALACGRVPRWSGGRHCGKRDRHVRGCHRVRPIDDARET